MDQQLCTIYRNQLQNRHLVGGFKPFPTAKFSFSKEVSLKKVAMKAPTRHSCVQEPQVESTGEPELTRSFALHFLGKRKKYLEALEVFSSQKPDLDKNKETKKKQTLRCRPHPGRSVKTWKSPKNLPTFGVYLKKKTVRSPRPQRFPISNLFGNQLAPKRLPTKPRSVCFISLILPIALIHCPWPIGSSNV